MGSSGPIRVRQIDHTLVGVDLTNACRSPVSTLPAMSPQRLRVREFSAAVERPGGLGAGPSAGRLAFAFAVLEIGARPPTRAWCWPRGRSPWWRPCSAGGVVADRASRRAVMVVADLVRVASQATMAALLITGAAEVWMLAPLAA